MSKVFVSHIEYEGIRLTYGVIVGTYDYHDQQGANKITINDDGYDIEQIFI